MTGIVRRCHFVIRMSFLENDKDGFFGLCAFVSSLVRHAGPMIVGKERNWLCRIVGELVRRVVYRLLVASLAIYGVSSL
jgi:hypothetical protein